MDNRPKHSASIANQTQTTSSLANQVKSPVTLTGRSRNNASLTNRLAHGTVDYVLATEALDFLVCEDGSQILLYSTALMLTNRSKNVAV